jgi:simple sugar transport system ATP-binding protein
MTVAENIVMANYPRGVGKAIAWGDVTRIAKKALQPWGLSPLAGKLVQDLVPIQMKVVEICRALSQNPSLLMLDEPTAGLDRQDAEHLFQYIDSLKKKKVTLIYVSHHLDEVYRFCDTATVLRDSRVVVTAPLSKLPKSALIAAMMGETEQISVPKRADRRTAPSAHNGLSIKNLTILGAVKGFDLEVGHGECVGIAGLEGSGKAEIGAAIAGLIKPTAGTVSVSGEMLMLGDVPAAIKAGIGYVPESRHKQGMVLTISVSENSTLTAMRQLSKPVIFGLMRILLRSVLRRTYGRLARQWNILAAGPDQLISELSGGNQQKCVMARALATRPKVLVLQNPTAGVDVAAKASIMRTLEEVLAQGASVVVISEDADDFVLASRIVVVNHGRIGCEFGSLWTDRELVAAMQGGHP